MKTITVSIEQIREILNNTDLSEREAVTQKTIEGTSDTGLLILHKGLKNTSEADSKWDDYIMLKESLEGELKKRELAFEPLNW